jgi:hypothetical protein
VRVTSHVNKPSDGNTSNESQNQDADLLLLLFEYHNYLGLPDDQTFLKNVVMRIIE